MGKPKIHKIGRYYYQDIPMECWGEPIILQSWKDEEIFTLVDYDGEPIRFFRKVRKSRLEGQKR